MLSGDALADFEDSAMASRAGRAEQDGQEISVHGVDDVTRLARTRQLHLC